jgi:hypothetical protein
MATSLRSKVARLERLANRGALSGPTCPACAAGPGLAVVIDRPGETPQPPPRRECAACGRERATLVIRVNRES